MCFHRAQRSFIYCEFIDEYPVFNFHFPDIKNVYISVFSFDKVLQMKYMLFPFHPYLQTLHPGHIHRSSKLLLAPCKARCCWVWVGVKTHPAAELSPSVQGAENGGGWQVPQTLVMRWVNDSRQTSHNLTMRLLSGLGKWLVTGHDFHGQ